jgi:peptidoglycan hydrolase CwlO-like protein
MGSTIAVATISGALTLIGTIITVLASNRKTAQNTELALARIDERVKNLTDEVAKHNNFAEKIPVLAEKIEMANHRIYDLENDVKKLSEGK